MTKNIFSLIFLLSIDKHASPAGFTFFPLVDKAAGMYLVLAVTWF